LIKANTINSGLSTYQALECGKAKMKARLQKPAIKKPIQFSAGWALINEV
jgi:hypothetical protein